MSTVREREDLVLEAWKKAYREQERDLRDAKTIEQVRQINRNVSRLHTKVLEVSLVELDANGPAIESAYQQAKRAKKEVEDAYNDEKELVARINLVTEMAGNIADLVKEGVGAPASGTA